MSDRTDKIAICGWCRTILPCTDDHANDYDEAQHHFFVAHGQAENQSVRWIYPDQAVEKLLAAAVKEAS